MLQRIHWHHTVISSLLGLALVGTAQAQTPSSSTAYRMSLSSRALPGVDTPVQLQLENTGNNGVTCGVEINWGDGKTDKFRLEAGKTLEATHTYAQPGAYAVVADGKLVPRGLLTAFPCMGPSIVAAVQVNDGSAAQASSQTSAQPTPRADTPQATAADASAQASPLDQAMLGDDASGKRVALLIGNAKYENALGRLVNPPNDVAVMQASLRRLGFEVHTALDVNKRGLMGAVKQFAKASESATVAMLYYSGHGIQSHGENYLLPVDAAIDKEADLDVEAVRLDGLLRQIEESKPRYTVVALDACRDNPVAKRQKSGLQGLARINQQPTSSFVAYATQAGTTAQDDGAFARSLAKRLQQPGVGMRTVFDMVARDVESASSGKQQPLRLDGLRNDIFLNGRAPVAVAPKPLEPELPPLCRDQQGQARDACMRWQCQTESAKAYAQACQGIL